MSIALVRTDNISWALINRKEVKDMENNYIEYYGKHDISPVKQDIKDIEVHYNRRKKLYRQCGIPAIAFRNAKILEVGPGGGIIH